MSKSDKKNRITGLIISSGVHLVLLVVLFFLVAFTPPYGTYGIPTPVISLGTSDYGSDGSMSETFVPLLENSSLDNEDLHKQFNELSSEDGEVSVKAKANEVKTEEVKDDIKNTSDGGNANLSQGNDIGVKGDKRNSGETLDVNGQYTNKRGNGGVNNDPLSLSMSGWGWADKPVIPELPDNVDGRIVFEIECDEDGEIIGINTVERGLSPRAEQLLKEQIRKNSLIRLSSGQVPPRSKGRVVFVLKTK